MRYNICNFSCWKLELFIGIDSKVIVLSGIVTRVLETYRNTKVFSSKTSDSVRYDYVK